MGDVFRKYRFSLQDVKNVNTIKDRLISLSLQIVCIKKNIIRKKFQFADIRYANIKSIWVSLLAKKKVDSFC